MKFYGSLSFSYFFSAVVAETEVVAIMATKFRHLSFAKESNT